MIECNKPEKGKTPQESPERDNMIYKIGKETGRNNKRSLEEITVIDILNEAISYFVDNADTIQYIKLIVIPYEDRKREIAKLRYHSKCCGFKLSIHSTDLIIRICITES